MEFTANTPISRSFPDGYETLYRVSYNYRSFALLLDALAIKSKGNKSVELVLPWCIYRSEGEEIDIHVLRLIDYAIALLHELNEKINHLQSKVYMLDLDINRCVFRIATEQPQAVITTLQSMPCPEVFNLPQIKTDTSNPTDIRQQFIG